MDPNAFVKMHCFLLVGCITLINLWHAVLAAPPQGAPLSETLFSGDINATLPLSELLPPNSSINQNAQKPDPWDMPITTEWGTYTIRWFSYGAPLSPITAARCIGKAYFDAGRHATGPDRSTAMKNAPNFNYYQDNVHLFMQLAGTEHFLFWRQWMLILARFDEYGKGNEWRETRFYLFRGRTGTGAYLAYGFLKALG